MRFDDLGLRCKDSRLMRTWMTVVIVVVVVYSKKVYGCQLWMISTIRNWVEESQSDQQTWKLLISTLTNNQDDTFPSLNCGRTWLRLLALLFRSIRTGYRGNAIRLSVHLLQCPECAVDMSV